MADAGGNVTYQDPLKGRVLIVDDEQSFAATTAALLEQEGYECAATYTHEGALTAVAEKEFDAIVCDINMTGNVRLELTSELSRRYPHIPVVLVTGYPSLDTAIQALGLSVSAYVLKPLDFTAFMKAVNDAVNSGRMQRTMKRTREALDPSIRAMTNQAEALPNRGSATFRTELESYMAFSQQQVLSSLSDLYSLARAAAATPDNKERLQLLDCPPLREYRKLLEEAVQVLEKTRSAFKSKDLAILRQKIESFLERLK